MRASSILAHLADAGMRGVLASSTQTSSEETQVIRPSIRALRAASERLRTPNLS
jgi:hypothetical protein